VGLSDEDIAFIHDKVYIDVGYGDLAHDDRALDIFIGRMLGHPEFANKIRAMVLPAYAALSSKIGASKGVVLDKSSLETLLRSAVLADLSQEASVTLWVHNWTKEAFSPPADYELDWSQLFDRGSRKVPSPDAWTNDLVPQLDALRKQVMAAGAARTIRLRGKCALSTGIALGATFPAVGSWTFEIPQPPAKESWRSDATPTPGYALQTEITEADPNGTDIVLGLNIRGDGRTDVMRYVESSGQTPNAFVFMAPPSQGAQSIGSDGEAVAMAMAVREELGKLLKARQLRVTRLFFYGPFALSVFLGQQLTSIGKIQLFEYQDPSYVPSCLLKT
jgi:CBASS immunity sensor of nucleotide second messenger signals